MIQITWPYFHLRNEQCSYLMTVRNGYLCHLHYGSPLQEGELESFIQIPGEPVGNAVFIQEGSSIETLSRYALEYPGFGEGDYREPAIVLKDALGRRTGSLLFKSYQILESKPVLSGQPQIRPLVGKSKSEGSNHALQSMEEPCLEIQLEDAASGLVVKLYYTLLAESTGIVRSVVFENTGEGSIKLERTFSASVDLPICNFELTNFYGDWIKERKWDQRPIGHGVTVIDSKRGVSGAIQNPFIMLSEPGTTEDWGRVYSLNLVYSGSFKAVVEKDSNDSVRMAMGINDFDFDWQLDPGEVFQTPEALMFYTEKGFNGLSQHSHKCLSHRIVAPQWQGVERPVLVNNWEATYFDFNEEKLLNLADAAVEVGVELFVLDDGWFVGRNGDTTSLGDWQVDLQKLPSGLKTLSEKIKDKGLQFGLWVEPEMISVQSELYRNHPEWLMSEPGRAPKHGRNQFILDLGSSEVVDELDRVLSKVFEQAQVDYVKWDMNRNFSNVYSKLLSPERQKETSHRYVLGLYALLERLTEKFPNVLFELCASGGNRFDPGMLYYMPQGWTSDNTDGLERQYIQYGTSVAYPPSVMGAHVSAIPNHQTGRFCPLATRFDVAAFGLLGYELDLTRLELGERLIIKEQIQYYKQHRQLLQFGDFYRCLSPFKGNYTAWMAVSKDGKEAIVGLYKKLTESNPGFRRLILSGLVPEQLYKVSGEGVNCTGRNEQGQRTAVFSGKTLMTSGLPLRPEYLGTATTEETWYFGDMGSCLFEIQAI